MSLRRHRSGKGSDRESLSDAIAHWDTTQTWLQANQQPLAEGGDPSRPPVGPTGQSGESPGRHYADESRGGIGWPSQPPPPQVYGQPPFPAPVNSWDEIVSSPPDQHHPTSFESDQQPGYEAGHGPAPQQSVASHETPLDDQTAVVSPPPAINAEREPDTTQLPLPSSAGVVPHGVPPEHFSWGPARPGVPAPPMGFVPPGQPAGAFGYGDPSQAGFSGDPSQVAFGYGHPFPPGPLGPGGQPGPIPMSPVPVTPPSVHDLTAQDLLRTKKRTPQGGWRKALYIASGHLINLGEGPADKRRRELVSHAMVPVPNCYRIGVISLKGGVGKTTVTVCLGATLASLRGDRVIAVDANPDRGTLSGKIQLESGATVRDLLNEAEEINRYSDVRRYTSQSPDRLEVLASESDPAMSRAFSEADYRTVAALLERFYNVVLTDCGTGLLHSAMGGVLDLANQLIIVSSGSVDGARSASATLDWLDAHGHSELVRGSVAVINSVRPRSGGVNLDRLEHHFASRTRAVARIPYDPHLEEGAEVDLGELRPATRHALLDLAAKVADGFPRPQQSTAGWGPTPAERAFVAR